MARRETADIYYDKEKVSKCLEGEWENILLLIEGALKSYSAGKVSQPVRAAVQIKKHNGLLLAMPAYDSELDSLATKVVTVFPESKKKGLNSVQSVVLLYDAADGKLKAILDGEVITSMRTAAASAVATKYLASKEAKHLAILGAGTQARSHYQAFCHIYNFEKIFIWNINTESAIKLRDEILETGKQCVVCYTVKDAVETADIIVTATMAQKPILKKEWIKMGAHINAVGAPVPEWQELENDLILSSVIYVDSREAALAESGDIIQSKADIYAEIGEVILGLKHPYVHKTTLFKSLGMAVEDVVTAELVYQILQKTNF